MNESTSETQASSWNEAHPWLVREEKEEEDSVGEVIRYSLDEMRFQ